VNFPERPTANPWQLVGQGLTLGAGIYDELRKDQMEDLQKGNLLQDMVERRTARVAEERRAAAEETRKQETATQEKETYQRSKDLQDRSDRARKEIQAGKTVPGKSVGGVVGPDEVMPYSPEEANRMLLGSGDLSSKDYVEASKPKPARLSVQEIGNRKVRLNLDTGEHEDLGPASSPGSRDRFSVQEVNGRKVRVNMDTGEQSDLGPVTARLKPGDVKTAKAKIQSLELARMQLRNVQEKFNGIKNSMSAGPLGQGKSPTPSGKAFDAAVDAVRNTITGLTRVPGVGAQSDYETRLTQAANPDRSDYESVTQQKIDQLNQLVETLATGYTGMLEENGPDEAEEPGPGSAGPAAPADRRSTLLRKKYQY
jgi:hypothetical protein